MSLNSNPYLKELTAIVLLTFGIILAFVALLRVYQNSDAPSFRTML